jgi:hypothetical protein
MNEGSRTLLSSTLFALLATGCGGDSERDEAVCRNAWQEVRIPAEFSEFHAATTTWHEGRLYVLRSIPVDGMDPFPELPPGLIFEPPSGFSSFAADGAPDLRGISLTHWVGSELLSFGQVAHSLGWVGRYDASRNEWLDADSQNAPLGSTSEAVVPMGDEALKMLARSDETDSTVEYHAYGPRTGWRTLEPPGTPALWTNGAWTGQEVVLWGKQENDLDDAPAMIRYDPSSGDWHSVSELGAPPTSAGTPGVWTGTELVVGGARYFPDGDFWQWVSDVGSVPGFGVAVGRRVVHWYVGWLEPGDVGGAVYDAEADLWGPPITTRCFGEPRETFHHVWVDSGLLVWTRDSRDRAAYLPAAAVFGDLPADPPDCACPPSLGGDG